MDKIIKYGILGAIAGPIVPYLLKLIAMLPVVESPFATFNEKIVGIDTALGTKVINFLSGFISIEAILVGAIGGAAFFMLGAYLADTAKLLTGSNFRKLFTVMMIAGITSGWIIAMAFSLPTFVTILNMVINAVVMALILSYLDTTLNLDLVP